MLTRNLDRVSKPSPVALAVLAVLFIVTRFIGASGAINFGTVSDVEIAYRRWAVRVVEQDRFPYSEIDIEYPPASLPLVLAPQLPEPTEHGYRVNFVALMLLFDIAGFLGLLMLAKRWGSMLGPLLWVIGLPLLGPFVYLRLDLAPAVATIWALQRASSDDWWGNGGLLGFGVAAKLYPLLLLPVSFFMSPRSSRLKVVVGSGAIILLAFLPFIAILGDVFREVIEYHTGRGIQIESLWGSILFIVRSGNPQRFIYHDFGAHHFELGAVSKIKIAASIGTIGAAGAGIWLARKGRRTPQEMAGVCFVTIMLAISVSGVLSPQFFIWVLALGAASVCVIGSRLRNQVLMLVPILLLTQIIFPNLHPRLVNAEPLAVVVLWCRNILLLVTAFYALARQAESAEDPTEVAVA
jgi:hypothetical protein